MRDEHLVHYGVKGMKWGKRKADGTSALGGKSGIDPKHTTGDGTTRGAAAMRSNRGGTKAISKGAGPGGAPLTEEDAKMYEFMKELDGELAALGSAVGSAAQPIIDKAKAMIDDAANPTVGRRVVNSVKNIANDIEDFFNPSLKTKARKAVNNAQNWLEDLFD